MSVGDTYERLGQVPCSQWSENMAMLVGDDPVALHVASGNGEVIGIVEMSRVALQVVGSDRVGKLARVHVHLVEVPSHAPSEPLQASSLWLAASTPLGSDVREVSLGGSLVSPDVRSAFADAKSLAGWELRRGSVLSTTSFARQSRKSEPPLHSEDRLYELECTAWGTWEPVLRRKFT